MHMSRARTHVRPDAVTRKLNQGGGAQFFSEIGLVLIDEVRGTHCVPHPPNKLQA